jgi:serine/threonine protein kinase
LRSFIEGRQSGLIRGKTAAHLEGCEACRQAVASAAPASGTLEGDGPLPPQRDPGALPRGANVGRYVVLSLVGRGGMGEVYAAYDPELDRKVALKLLHGGGTSGGPEGRARLLREAKAIAKLSHPNVVVVHDAGTIDDRVFIAMEFVDGQTVAEWLKAAPRSWRVVRDVFLDAGRALSAAHSAGLVHRDFKPQNVMVGEDGKVRVMDFGLAARAEAGEARAKDDLAAGDFVTAGPDVLTTAALTRTGVLVGTPAYMAPEQFLAAPTDARTDQFSFCVSLHEALFGERPFPGKTFPELAAAVIAGRPREPTQKGRAPVWMRRAIARGLQPQREQRWPSMDELLATLARDPERQRRRVIAAAAAAVVLLVGGAIAQRAVTKPQATLCRGAGARLAGAWELPTTAGPGPLHEALRAAFSATGVGYAEDTGRRTTKILDDYARRWSDTYTATCEATQLRGEQSVEVMDLRMDCLGRALDGLGSLTKLLSRANADIVVEAVNSAFALPELDRCSNVSLLRAVTPPPRDPKVRAVIDDLRRRNAEAKALLDTGQAAEAQVHLESLMRDARAAGYAPVEADVLRNAGQLYNMTFHRREAERTLERSFWLALESRVDELAAEDATSLAGLGRDVAHRSEAVRWEQMSETLLRRLGPGQERTRAWLQQAYGNTAYADGRFEVAREAYARAAELKVAALGADHPDTALSIESMANALLGLGRPAEALAVHARAFSIVEHAYGRDSPLLWYMLSNEGEILTKLGRAEDAIRAFRRALDLRRHVVEDVGADLGFQLTGLGRALLLAGRGAEAVAPLERALRVREKKDPEPERLGETRFALARALAMRDHDGDAARARSLAKSARDDYRKMLASKLRDESLAAIDRWLSARR